MLIHLRSAFSQATAKIKKQYATNAEKREAELASQKPISEKIREGKMVAEGMRALQTFKKKGWITQKVGVKSTDVLIQRLKKRKKTNETNWSYNFKGNHIFFTNPKGNKHTAYVINFAPGKFGAIGPDHNPVVVEGDAIRAATEQEKTLILMAARK